MTTLRYKYKQDQTTHSIPIKFQTFRWGERGCLMIAGQQTESSISIPIMGNITDLITELRQAANQLEEMVVTAKDKARLASARAEVEDKPVEASFTRITLSHIKPDMPEYKKWELLIERFRNSPAGSDGFLAGLIEKYEQAKKLSQPQIDVDLVRPYLDEVSGDRYPQARIAELIGVTNAGGGRTRILAVMQALNLSTTTSDEADLSDIPLKQAA